MGKTLWERIHKFGLSLELDYDSLIPPRENNECIMERLVRDGVRGKELVGLNRVRKCQEALFWSDIATANGARIDSVYVRDWRTTLEGRLGKHRSRFKFSQECPTD